MSPELEARVGNRNRRVYEMTMGLAILSLGALFTCSTEVFLPGNALAPLALLVAPQVWALIFTVLGTTRLVALIVNGFWPLGPTVRWSLSIVSILFVWAPIVAAYWWNLPATAAFPSLVLAPIAMLGEANCLFALAALRAGGSHAR